MKQVEEFWACVKKDEGGLLATSANDRVTMRVVSPVYYDSAILIFTSPDSLKYQQLKENPLCCISIGGSFLEAKAEFHGHTMKDENASLREVYSAKFNDAFDENLAFGGRESEFIILKPVRLRGWTFDNGIPVEPFEHAF